MQAVNAIKAAQQAALAELDTLFASLQQHAFRGEFKGRAVHAKGLQDYPNIGKGAHGTPYT